MTGKGKTDKHFKTCYACREVHTFQRDDLLLRVHNGRVGGDGPPHDIIGICQVDDDDLVLLANFFSYADKVVRFKSERLGCVFFQREWQLEPLSLA